MQTFEITFGSGADAVCLTEMGSDVLQVLNHLAGIGWEVAEVTGVKRVS